MNIILVDDEEIAVNSLKRRVDWEKYGVRDIFIAHSMKEAQRIFDTQRIDVLLSDIEMPLGSGLELFEWVKIYYPAVECIYITCHPEYEYMRKAMQLGSVDFVLKPIDYAELDCILSELVKRIRTSRGERPLSSSSVIKTAEERGKSGDMTGVIKNYIRDHLQETIYMSSLAGEVFLNEQYMMRMFKKSEGVSILEYITGERLRIAKQLLLETAYPIHQVAASVGYTNYSYFTRLFKREVGCTPQIYRQKGGRNF